MRNSSALTTCVRRACPRVEPSPLRQGAFKPTEEGMPSAAEGGQWTRYFGGHLDSTPCALVRSFAVSWPRRRARRQRSMVRTWSNSTNPIRSRNGLRILNAHAYPPVVIGATIMVLKYLFNSSGETTAYGCGFLISLPTVGDTRSGDLGGKPRVPHLPKGEDRIRQRWPFARLDCQLREPSDIPGRIGALLRHAAILDSELQPDFAKFRTHYQQAQ